MWFLDFLEASLDLYFLRYFLHYSLLNNFFIFKLCELRSQS